MVFIISLISFSLRYQSHNGIFFCITLNSTGIGFGSYEDCLEKAGFYVANRQKVVPLQVILYGMAYYSVITAFS
jgi:hypothetical protein